MYCTVFALVASYFIPLFWQGLKGGTGEKGEKVGAVQDLIDARF